MSQWLKLKRDRLYSQWISQFIGDVGQNVKIHKPLHLEGDGLDCVHIGCNSTFQENCVIGCRKYYGNQTFVPEIRIGDNCDFGAYCHISAVNRVVIGDGLLTGRFVYIGDNAHGTLSAEESNIPPGKRGLRSKGPIIIGNNVWLGDKVTILAGVSVGSNVIVAANSVVTRDIPSNCMAAGSPARIVKKI